MKRFIIHIVYRRQNSLVAHIHLELNRIYTDLKTMYQEISGLIQLFNLYPEPKITRFWNNLIEVWEEKKDDATYIDGIIAIKVTNPAKLNQPINESSES